MKLYLISLISIVMLTGCLTTPKITPGPSKVFTTHGDGEVIVSWTGAFTLEFSYDLETWYPLYISTEEGEQSISLEDGLGKGFFRLIKDS